MCWASQVLPGCCGRSQCWAAARTAPLAPTAGCGGRSAALQIPSSQSALGHHSCPWGHCAASTARIPGRIQCQVGPPQWRVGMCSFQGAGGGDWPAVLLTLALSSNPRDRGFSRPAPLNTSVAAAVHRCSGRAVARTNLAASAEAWEGW